MKYFTVAHLISFIIDGMSGRRVYWKIITHFEKKFAGNKSFHECLSGFRLRIRELQINSDPHCVQFNIASQKKLHETDQQLLLLSHF